MHPKKTVTGVLKGYDQLLNLVLDEVEEQVQGNDIYSLYHQPFLTRNSAVPRSRTAHTHTRPRRAPRTHNNTAQPRRRARRDLKSIHRTRLNPPFPHRRCQGPLVPLRPLHFSSCFLNVINERCNLILDHARLSTLTMMHVHASRANGGKRRQCGIVRVCI